MCRVFFKTKLSYKSMISVEVEEGCLSLQQNIYWQSIKIPFSFTVFPHGYLCTCAFMNCHFKKRSYPDVAWSQLQSMCSQPPRSSPLNNQNKCSQFTPTGLDKITPETLILLIDSPGFPLLCFVNLTSAYTTSLASAITLPCFNTVWQLTSHDANEYFLWVVHWGVKDSLLDTKLNVRTN